MQVTEVPAPNIYVLKFKILIGIKKGKHGEKIGKKIFLTFLFFVFCFIITIVTKFYENFNDICFEFFF